ncbi:MAG: hypothetical protein LLG14_27435 [Nocardiaceae bacterium]|nr:hypothetical protein [Nocardiaceae bacterium]
MKYVLAACFGFWLGMCLSDWLDGVSRRGGSYLQRIEQLEQRMNKLEKPIHVEPKQEQTA